MKKYFLDYEKSLELKQLGFDEECLAFYNRNNKLVSIQQQSDKVFNTTNNITGVRVVAPLIQQVKEWLRKKHNWEVIVAPRFYGDGSLWYCYEIICTTRNTIETLNDNLFKGAFQLYKTYKEAELEAIRECIKIIKNENQNK